MKTYSELIETQEYWMEEIQNEIFRQVYNHMREEKINQTELANRFNVSKGYISQILNGNFNFSLRKLIELSLKMKVVPNINFEPIDEYSNRKDTVNTIMLPITRSILPPSDKIKTAETTNNETVQRTLHTLSDQPVLLAEIGG